MTMGDRLVVMNQGRIKQVDTPQNLYDRPDNRFVAGFIGSPPMNFITCKVSREDGGLHVRTEALNFRIPSEKAPKLELYIGREVILGIRPEHILDALTTEPGPERGIFQALVWVVEPLGSEKFVHLRAGTTMLVVRMPPHVPLKTGESAMFVARMEYAYFFDKENEEIIA
jgi:multiple sugar transport system ATP-binding protein